MSYLGTTDIIRVTNYNDLLGPPVMPADVSTLAFDTTNNITYQYNGTTWLPLGRPNVKLSTVLVNAMATGTTLIYTLEQMPINFVPTQIVATVVTKTGTIVTAPIITVGTNATSYNNIASGSLVGTLLSALGIGSSQPVMASTSPKLPAGTQIYANVTTAAIGPTALTINIDILGYLKS